MRAIKVLINTILKKTGYRIINTLSLESLGLEIKDLRYLSTDLANKCSELNSRLTDLNKELALIKSENRFERIIFHNVERGQPDIRLAQTITRKNESRVKIAERLITAYHKATEAEKTIKFAKPEEDLWTALVQDQFAELLSILAERDPIKLADYLMDFGKEYTGFGGLTFSLGGYGNEKVPECIALAYFDKLVCLAEYLGILAVEHPEYGNWGENIYQDIDGLITKIEQALGIDITPPQNIVSVYGIYTKKGVFNYRHINSLYTAARIKSLLPGLENPCICEYGGGLGTVAWYLSKMGITGYTIFDLPIVNVLSGHFLLNCLPAEQIVLYGEEDKEKAIKIYPYWMCEQIPEKYFDLSLNQDSFPEIDEITVKKYFKEIARTSRRYFLNINQEAQSPISGKENSKRQLNISEILANDENFRKFYRFRYWVREGYVEELYKIE
jgi:hypothetical protein